MKIKILMALALLVAIYEFSSCGTVQKPAPAATLQDSIARGKYLVSVIGCGDCHSPKVFGPMGPVPDTSLELSGHPASLEIGPINKDDLKSWVLFGQMNTVTVGPWGVSYAANLTSDESGIGNWTEAQFFTAMRKGKYKGIETNRPLLPPMPWPNYAQLSDEDLKSIFLFLKNTKPVKNIVPAAKSPAEI